MNQRTRYSESEYAQMLKLRGLRGSVRKGAMPSQDTHRVIASAPSAYRNKWEETYAALLAMEQQAGIIKAWAYESMTLKLAKGKYHRIDFLIWELDGSIELAQIKGRFHKNIRASLTGLKWAAQLNPWFKFTLKRRVGREWESTRVEI